MLPIKRARRGKRERAILTVIPWDVWAAAAIAAVGIILAVVFDQAPLLVFFLVVWLCAPTLQSETGSVTKMRLPSKTWIKVKNPKAPAATRAIDGTF
jgi:uncharacterized protein (DUF58 family)